MKVKIETYRWKKGYFKYGSGHFIVIGIQWSHGGDYRIIDENSVEITLLNFGIVFKWGSGKTLDLIKQE